MLPASVPVFATLPDSVMVIGRSATPVTSSAKGAIETALRRTTRSSLASMWNGSSKVAIRTGGRAPALVGAAAASRDLGAVDRMAAHGNIDARRAAREVERKIIGHAGMDGRRAQRGEPAFAIERQRHRGLKAGAGDRHVLGLDGAVRPEKSDGMGRGRRAGALADADEIERHDSVADVRSSVRSALVSWPRWPVSVPVTPTEPLR